MNAFTGQNLAEKLSKLNSSQQSIETLSHWCIFHRKKARHVVHTWEKEYYDAPKEQRLPFLYLANDILQNSKKKGTEFVTEFWKVLPNALKDVIENGEEAARNSAFRLVDIWEDRKVFGSRPQSLRDELLGDRPAQVMDAPPPPAKPKSLTAGYLDKLAAAFQAVQDGSKEEDATLGKCNTAISRVASLEKEAQFGSINGEAGGSIIIEELEKQQGVLNQCVEQLEAYEKSRDLLVSQLKEMLSEQERKLESLRTSVQIAQAQAEQAGSLRHRLVTGSPIGMPAVSLPPENGPSDDLGNGGHGSAMMHQHHDSISVQEKLERANANRAQPISPPAPLPVLERAPSSDEDGSKLPQNPAVSVAAEVAARLAANASSAAVLTSVLSSLAAQESSSLGHSSPLNQHLHEGLVGHLDKRQRLENHVSLGDVMGQSPSDGGGQQSGNYMQHQQSISFQSSAGLQHSSGAGGGQVQQQQQVSQGQGQPPNSQQQLQQAQLHKQLQPPLPQYLQGGQGQVQIIPPGPPPPSQYAYAGGPGMGVLQQGPPHPSLMQNVTGVTRMQHPPGLSTPNSFPPLQPPGMAGFYSQPPLPAPPAPVPRQ